MAAILLLGFTGRAAFGQERYPLRAGQTLYLTGTLQLQETEGLSVRLNTRMRRGSELQWTLHGSNQPEQSANAPQSLELQAGAILSFRFMRTESVVRLSVGTEAGHWHLLEVDWPFDERLIVEFGKVDHLQIERVDVPLDGQLLWLRPDDLPQTRSVSHWPDASSFDYAEVKGEGQPTRILEGDAVLGCHFQGDAYLQFRPQTVEAEVAEAFLLFVPLRDYASRNPLWALGTATGATYDGKARTWSEDFASSAVKSFLADLKPGLPHLVHLSHGRQGWQVTLNGQLLSTLLSESEVSMSEILTLAGHAAGQGEMLLAEVLLYGRSLDRQERAAISKRLLEDGHNLTASLQVLDQADPTTLSSAQQALMDKLRSIAPLEYGNGDAVEGMGWAHGVSPGGGVVYYVDNVRGSDAHDGLSLTKGPGRQGPLATMLEGYRRVKDGDALFIIATGKIYESPTEMLSDEKVSIYHASNGEFQITLGGDNRQTVRVLKERTKTNSLETRPNQIPMRFQRQIDE